LNMFYWFNITLLRQQTQKVTRGLNRDGEEDSGKASRYMAVMNLKYRLMIR